MPAALTLHELQQGLAPGCRIIDIRTPFEFANGHFKGAVNIPYEVLMMYPESYLKKGETYYLLCAHGSLSHRASRVLQAYGYRVANVKHGYDARCCCY